MQSTQFGCIGQPSVKHILGLVWKMFGSFLENLFYFHWNIFVYAWVLIVFETLGTPTIKISYL